MFVCRQRHGVSNWWFRYSLSSTKRPLFRFLTAFLTLPVASYCGSYGNMILDIAQAADIQIAKFNGKGSLKSSDHRRLTA